MTTIPIMSEPEHVYNGIHIMQPERPELHTTAIRTLRLHFYDD